MVVFGLIAVVVLLAVFARSGSVTSEGDTTLVRIPLIGNVQVASEAPLLEDPDQYQGVPGPSPDFDMSAYGPDLTFEQRPDQLTPLTPDQVLRAVYLGHDQDDEPYYIWHRGSEDFLDFLGQILADFGSFGRLMTSYGTHMGGPGIFNEQPETSEGIVSGSIQSSSDGGTVLTAEWHSLPEELAAVVFYLDGDPYGWQTPISGTAAIQVWAGLDHAQFGAVKLVGLDSHGEVWKEVNLFG